MFASIMLLLIGLLLVVHVQARLMFMEMNESSAVHFSKHLDNQHIVFMGDSLMRYQYLSLAYLVHHNKVVDPTEVPSILIEKTYEGWLSFWNATHAALSPFEFCDCGSRGENRYYYNPIRNISLSFVVYVGDHIPSGGRWQPSDNVSNHVDQGPYTSAGDAYWVYHTIQDAITNIAAKLTPKPSVLVLNAGHWANKWNETAHRDSVFTLAKSLFPRVIWKTTNYPNDHRFGGMGHDISVEASDASACAYPGVECLNLNWTQQLDGSNYWDRVHFKPAIYTDVNIQFMYQLLRQKALVVTPMSSEHHAQIVNHNGKQYVVDRYGVLRPFARPTEPVCVAEVARRNHVHLGAPELVNHILGEPVIDICGFSL